LNNNILEEYSQVLIRLSRDTSQSVVAILRKYGDGITEKIGSGVIINSKGYVITCSNLIQDIRKDALLVKVHSGMVQTPKIIGFNPSYNVALLQINPDNLRPLEMTNSKVASGQLVFAVTNYGNDVSVRQGIISSEKVLVPSTSPIIKVNALLLDIHVSFRYLGTSIIDTNGKMIGLVIGFNNKEAFALDLSKIEKCVNEIEKYGLVEQPYLGLSYKVIDIPAESQRGLLIYGIAPGSPAESSGITVGDVILAVKNQPVQNSGDLNEIIRQEDIGQQLDLSLLKGNQKSTITITPAKNVFNKSS